MTGRRAGTDLLMDADNSTWMNATQQQLNIDDTNAHCVASDRFTRFTCTVVTLLRGFLGAEKQKRM